jgi:hypothetical protein
VRSHQQALFLLPLNCPKNLPSCNGVPDDAQVLMQNLLRLLNYPCQLPLHRLSQSLSHLPVCCQHPFFQAVLCQRLSFPHQCQTRKKSLKLPPR